MAGWRTPFGLGVTILSLLMAWDSHLITRLVQRHFFGFNWFYADGLENLLLSIVLCSFGLLLLSTAQGRSPLWSLAATTLYLSPYGYGSLRIFGFIAPVIALLTLTPAPAPLTRTPSDNVTKEISLLDVLREYLAPRIPSSKKFLAFFKERIKFFFSRIFLRERLTISSLGFLFFASLLPAFSILRTVGVTKILMEARQGNSYYVILPFMEMLLIYGGAGILGILAAIYLTFRKYDTKKGTLIGITSLLLGMFTPFVLLPMAPEYGTPINARHRVMQRMESVQIALTQWREKQGRYPATKKEVNFATSKITSPKAVSLYGDSRVELPPHAFAVKNNPRKLPYKLTYIASHMAPYRPQPDEGRPGEIFYTVSSDFQKAWLTGMGLAPGLKVSSNASVIHTVNVSKLSPSQLRWINQTSARP